MDGDGGDGEDEEDDEEKEEEGDDEEMVDLGGEREASGDVDDLAVAQVVDLHLSLNVKKRIQGTIFKTCFTAAHSV